jgi:hypothetical protein
MKISVQYNVFHTAYRSPSGPHRILFCRPSDFHVPRDLYQAAWTRVITDNTRAGRVT